ncbi:MAG: DUF1848 domain-containing protein [Armatimonadota bacterium]|nr:MAG: DUF1848 domain-containing protein [Armatimonadota bacterium]
MIISASSRTDIPAFYGNWFHNRLDAGYCLSVNPFNGHTYRISLRREDVDGFFFWTKNLRPFLPKLAVLQERGFPFVIHYTINGYPRFLEPSIPPAETAIAHMRSVAQACGPVVGIWRYDPILITSATDFNFHRDNFARLTGALAGVVDEVVVAYASFVYRKTGTSLARAARQAGFQWEDPARERKRDFLTELSAIAARNGMTLRLCAQPEYLSPGIAEAICIDAQRLSEVANRPILGWKPGHRGTQCACHYSRDIGAYDTCLHGCAYCYAVTNLQVSRKFFEQHDPSAEWLCAPRRMPKRKPQEDLPLFCRDRQG